MLPGFLDRPLCSTVQRARVWEGVYAGVPVLVRVCVYVCVCYRAYVRVLGGHRLLSVAQ